MLKSTNHQCPIGSEKAGGNQGRASRSSSPPPPKPDICAKKEGKVPKQKTDRRTDADKQILTWNLQRIFPKRENGAASRNAVCRNINKSGQGTRNGPEPLFRQRAEAQSVLNRRKRGNGGKRAPYAPGTSVRNPVRKVFGGTPSVACPAGRWRGTVLNRTWPGWEPSGASGTGLGRKGRFRQSPCTINKEKTGSGPRF